MTDPFAYRRLFNISMSYGGVIFLLLCLGPLQTLFAETITPERIRDAATSIGGMIPVAMGISAAVAGMVRKVVFRMGGINRQSLCWVFMLGAFWQLPFTLCVAYAAAKHETAAWELPVYFTAACSLAAAVLTLALYLSAPKRPS